LVIVGAQVQAFQPVVQFIARGEQDHRRIAAVAAQGFQDRQAVAARHHDVEQDDVVLA
jgi:hypothetical protein